VAGTRVRVPSADEVENHRGSSASARTAPAHDSTVERMSVMGRPRPFGLENRAPEPPTSHQPVLPDHHEPRLAAPLPRVVHQHPLVLTLARCRT
jgi:hypothetical protein